MPSLNLYLNPELDDKIIKYMKNKNIKNKVDAIIQILEDQLKNVI